MTESLVLGIMAIYLATGQQVPLSLYGDTLTSLREKLNKLIEQAGYPKNFGYTIDVGTIPYHKVTYYFTDLQFLRGLITGAKWLNINPQQYLTTLTTYRNRYGDNLFAIEVSAPLPFEQLVNNGISIATPLRFQ